MPLKWDKARNPYRSNYFGNLQLGPNATHVQIQAKARELTQKIAAGQQVKTSADQVLDEHAVNESATKLRDPRAAAEELLLVHPQAQSDDQAKVRAAIDQLRRHVSLPDARPPIPLRDAFAVFWFVAPPGPEAVEPPAWDELGLVAAGDAEDLALDIVFDA